MRKEASADLWKMLYDLTDELKELKPWKELGDMDLIGIQENGREEPVFCSITGKDTTVCGISLYDGTRGLASYEKAIGAYEYGNMLPADYTCMNQQALTCCWTERIYIPEDQRAVMKALGRKYQGKGNWPLFLSHRPRFTPWTPDEEEVSLIIETFVQLIEAVNALREERVKVDFEGGEFCFRYFDLEQMNWMTAPARLPYVEEKYVTFMPEDEELVKQLARMPKNGLVLLLDTAYLHGAMTDKRFEKYDRPVNPLLLLAVDQRNSRPLNVRLLSPEEEEGLAAARSLLLLVESVGRPEQILVRNPYIFMALGELCEALHIGLHQSPLKEMDPVIEELRQQADRL